MDRNSLIGLLLIVAIVFVFSYMQTPSKEELERNRMVSDSIVRVEAAKAKTITERPADNTLNNVSSITTQKTDDTIAIKNQLGNFASSAFGEQSLYTMENDLIKVVFTNKGGRVYSVELKKFKTHDQKPLILFNGDSTVFSFNFGTNNARTIATGDLYFKALSPKNIIVNKNDTLQKFIMQLPAGENSYIEYVYSLSLGSYKLGFEVNMVGMDSVIAKNWNTIDLKWSLYIPQQEKERKNEITYTSVVYKYLQESSTEMDASKDDNNEKLNNRLRWIAYKQQFFSSVLIAENSFENGVIQSKKLTDTSHLCMVTSDLTIPYEHNQKVTIPFAFYFGPNHFNTLKIYGYDLIELVKLGKNIVKWFNRYLIIPIFNFLNRFIGNYGIIILLLTLIIKMLLFPLTYKSYLSQAKMRVLKPQIDEINEKISADKPMERQQATMALYRKVGVNPLGGCLPMLLQLPILLAMFRFFPTSIELRQEGFLWAHDLSTYDSIFEWKQHIPYLSDFYGNHISLFTILMTITTLMTIKMNSQSTSTTSMPGMKTMMYIMPIMFMFILNRFSSGLTYYYFLANLITIIQNEVFKYFVNEDKLLAQLNENKKKAPKKSNWQAKLEQIAKDKGYKSLK